jgi:tetratricopeptide (TPR) repeat protein
MMMLYDCRGLEITAASSDAVAAFDRTIDSYLGIKPEAAPNLKATFEADPEMPMAHAMKSYFFMLMATGPLKERSRKAAADATNYAQAATKREKMHAEAASHWSHGRKSAALATWEAILVTEPRDILALRLAHHGHFYEGDGQNLRDTVTRRLFAWTPDIAGYGYVKGMQAFGFEETHNYDAALRAGHEAVEINGHDAWAIHAVAHVHEMCDESQVGIDWIKKNNAGWQSSNNFRYHVQWHQMLMYLDQQNYDEVLRQYDEELWGEESEEYLDLVNDAAVLLRLELHGQSVGARWEALAEKCKNHTTDQALAFIDVHHAISLSSVPGDDVKALLDAMESYAADSGDDNAEITGAIGVPLAHALVAHRAGDHGAVVDLLMPLRYRLHLLGGSHAQRDLFSMVLISSAIASGRTDIAKMLVSERLARLPHNVWTLDCARQIGIAA